MGLAESVSAPVRVPPVKGNFRSVYCFVAAPRETVGSAARIRAPVMVPPALSSFAATVVEPEASPTKSHFPFKLKIRN